MKLSAAGLRANAEYFLTKATGAYIGNTMWVKRWNDTCKELGQRALNNVCPYSGCNYPEGECSAECLPVPKKPELFI